MQVEVCTDWKKKKPADEKEELKVQVSVCLYFQHRYYSPYQYNIYAFNGIAM